MNREIHPQGHLASARTTAFNESTAFREPAGESTPGASTPGASTPAEESAAYFAALRDNIRFANEHGRLDEALDLCDEAICWAQDRQRPADVDLALCNRASILVNLGRGEEVASRLRRILLSSADPRNCFLASYNLSRFHDHERESDRAMFYAQQCLDYAQRSDSVEFLAGSYNQMGVLQVAGSYFAEACESYEAALALAVEDNVTRATMLSNLGYCRVVLGEHREGFRRLFASLRLMRRQGLRTWAMLPHLALSYAYIEIGKLEAGRRHAATALPLAEAAEHRESVMNALYLLGEGAKLMGDELAAYEHYQRLQREFYPDKSFIPDFLMVTDCRKLVNLMA